MCTRNLTSSCSFSWHVARTLLCTKTSWFGKSTHLINPFPWRFVLERKPSCGISAKRESPVLFPAFMPTRNQPSASASASYSSSPPDKNFSIAAPPAGTCKFSCCLRLNCREPPAPFAPPTFPPLPACLFPALPPPFPGGGPIRLPWAAAEEGCMFTTGSGRAAAGGPKSAIFALHASLSSASLHSRQQGAETCGVCWSFM
mmetsp:Transcript_2213/g.5239  ORF Transcript_2213/g.5239 Transcript_2213/m.5239 type:complete len:201 (-) Transcript_2213:1519-2121(-)